MSAPARQPILPLPPAEVEKICAGEVVERPLSVVKELVENALDAGATEISVELEDGGKRLIRVADNGGGIPADELALALKPHCTSKLRSLDDLYRIGTLGFRGEALGAISAVSKLTLSSRYSGASGPAWRIESHGGKVVAEGPCNLQQGTEVEVGELFYNVPARLKFLRSAQSETAQVSSLLTTYALAYPEVSFSLHSGGRLLLKSDGDGDLLSVATDVLGRELADDLAAVDFEHPPCAVRGYISAPHRHWHNRTRQWLLVNRRPVQNKLLSKAIDDALREFLSPGKFPAGVLLLELPPDQIDVNVHPAKLEVAFAEPQEVYSLLVTALRRALGAAAAERQRRLTHGMSLVVTPAERRELPHVLPPGLDFSAEQLRQAELVAGNDDIEAAAASYSVPERSAAEGQTAVPVYELERRFVAEAQRLGQVAEAGESSRPIEFRRPEPQPAPPVAPKLYGELRVSGEALRSPEGTELPFDSVTQIMQVADSYLVLVTPGEVYLIDQHSAHERVLFEELWERLAVRGEALAASQALLFEQELPLAPGEAVLAGELVEAVQRLGFRARIEDGALLISAVPALLVTRIGPELLAATLAELAADGSASSLDDVLKQLAAGLACKAAVKANQPLPQSERMELARLITTRFSSLTCPHGRPTVVRLGPGELEKLFLRS